MNQVGGIHLVNSNHRCSSSSSYLHVYEVSQEVTSNYQYGPR